MAGCGFTRALGLLYFVSRALAIPRLELVPTPTGLMAEVGMSLLPTQAPGLNGIPRELLRRQNPPFPPPANYCGFVNGRSDDILSCTATDYCVYFGSAMGCCESGLFATCTQVFTACREYTDFCDAACMSNHNILKCALATRPYCGTYRFAGGTSLLNCERSPLVDSSVQFLMDFYISSLSTLISSVGPIFVSATTQWVQPVTVTAPLPPSPLSSQNTTSPNPSPDNKSGGLSTGAIIGIAVGAVVVVLAIIIALLIVFCIRRRDRNRRESQANPGNHGLPMQTQSLLPPNGPFDGKPYQPVSQQEISSAHGPLSPPLPTYSDQKPIPPPSPISTPQPTENKAMTALGRKPVAGSPNASNSDRTRYSEAPSAMTTPRSPSIPHPNLSEVDGDIYRGPTSYNMTEVEGLSIPLRHSGQSPLELEHRYHSGMFEAPGSTMFRTPSENNIYEMESGERYAQ